MGMGFAPTWLRQVSPPPCFTKTLTTRRIQRGWRGGDEFPTGRLAHQRHLCTFLAFSSIKVRQKFDGGSFVELG